MNYTKSARESANRVIAAARLFASHNEPPPPPPPRPEEPTWPEFDEDEAPTIPRMPVVPASKGAGR
jgi:hypothetical protein